ncbi:MAG: C-GCAxxG-C-C family protein [Desulfobacterota bacterium]|nr:C-GCAxxG-C-C family protein [Thermodesulfobacteriota bacterium]
MGLDMIGEEERDTVLRAMSGLTGGCYRGDFCGAIAGAVQVVGALFGKAGPQDMEDSRLTATIKTVYDRLKDLAVSRYGDTSCQTISRCNWYDPEDVKARRIDGRRDECTRFVGECARVVGEVLLEVVGEEELRLLQGEA